MQPLNSRIFHSRPRAEADWNCPRSRYYLYEFDGKGLNADVESVEQFFGTTIHDGLACIAFQHRDNKGDIDIDAIGTVAGQQVREQLLSTVSGTDEYVENFANEQACLSEGLIRGFYRQQWPAILREYPKILSIEADVSYIHNSSGDADPKGDFEFLAKPDLVQATDDESTIVYREYKSTANKKEKWINSWDRSVQVHATQEAIAQTLGIRPTGAIVHGLYKGYESWGKLSTPIAYAYHKAGSPPFIREEIAYEYRAGLRRYPVWLLQGGIKKWIENMPDDVLMEQFPVTPVIFPDPATTKRFFRQRALRELEIREASQKLLRSKLSPGVTEKWHEEILDRVFPQHNHKCKPAWGFECPFQVLCFGDVTDPLKAGFTYRQAHHTAEIDSLDPETED